jgi:REP element-mobilizing transposase RayT
MSIEKLLNLKLINLKYKNKYRIATTRLQSWDYCWNGLYFVTICTKKKYHFFGEVIDGEMVLSKIGKLVEKYWNEIPLHFKFVKLNEFVVMPNHIHGIIVIDKNNDEMDVGTANVGAANVETPKLGVSTDT